MYLGGIRVGVKPHESGKASRFRGGWGGSAADVSWNSKSEHGITGKGCMLCFMLQNSWIEAKCKLSPGCSTSKQRPLSRDKAGPKLWTSSLTFKSQIKLKSVKNDLKTKLASSSSLRFKDSLSDLLPVPDFQVVNIFLQTNHNHSA